MKPIEMEHTVEAGIDGLKPTFKWTAKFSKHRKGDVHLLSERIFKVFADHGVSASRIPEVVPREFGLAVADCVDAEALLPKISEELLDWVVGFFGIQREWLAGEDVPIYERFGCYKYLDRFIEQVVESRKRSDNIELLFAVNMNPKTLEWRGRADVALVLREHLMELGSRDIWRYRVCYDSWTWNHPPAHDNLIAIARLWFFDVGDLRTVAASADEIKQLWAGKMIPDVIFSDPSRNNPHLDFEDCAMTSSESFISRDDGSVASVEAWIQQNGWHDELRSKLKALGHEPPQRLAARMT